MKNRLNRLLLALPAILFVITPFGEAQVGSASPGDFDAALWGLNLRGSGVVSRDEGSVRLAFGWPRMLPNEVPLWGRSPAVVDLDRNGDFEVGIICGDGRLAVYQHDGAQYPGFPLAEHRGNRANAWVDPTHPVPCAISDVDRDELSEFLYITDIGYVHAVNLNHAEPQLYPYDAGRTGHYSTIVANDFNGDFQSEMVFSSQSLREQDQDSLALLHVVRGNTEEVASWPVAYGYFSTSSPAVGDIDGDGGAEIVIGSARRAEHPGQIHVLKIDGLRQQGFPVGDFETIGSAPTLVDLNGDEKLDILFYAKERDVERQGLYALDFHGQPIHGFPVATNGGHPYGSPVVGGTGPNGALQIAFGTFDADEGARIELFNLDGTPVDGFPIRTSSPAVVGSVIMVDVTGDGICEIVAAMAPSASESGWIGAWSSSGQMADGFPISLDNYGGRAFASSPTATDLNDNGYTDLICPTTDGYLFVWTTPGFFMGDMWPTEKGGFERLGVRPPRRISAVKREPEVISPSIFSISVSPNPFNSTTALNFVAAPGSDTKIALYDAQGRFQRTIFNGHVESTGQSHRVQLDASGLATGLYIIQWQSGSTRGAQKLVYLP